MPNEVGSKPKVAAWLLPAIIMSTVPASLSGSALSNYLRSQGGTEETLGWLAATWVTWRLVVLWVVPLEFLARRRRIVLMLQGAIVVAVAILAAVCWQSGSPLAVVAMGWILALLSATHAAAIEGLFVTELSERAQIKYTLIDPLFWGLGRMAVSGGLVGAVGRHGDGSWGIGLAVTAVVLALILLWQSRALPDPEQDEHDSETSLMLQCVAALRELTGKPMLGPMLVVSSLVALPASLATSAILDFVLSLEGSTHQSMGEWFAIATFPALATSLVGMLLVLRYGLEKTFFAAAILTNVTVPFAIVASTLSPDTDRTLLLALLVLANSPLQLAAFISSLYIVQQIAPGRYSMSAHAFATVAMLLASHPVHHATDFLQERLGYSLLFTFLALLAAVAIALARRAPFLRKYREEPVLD